MLILLLLLSLVQSKSLDKRASEILNGNAKLVKKQEDYGLEKFDFTEQPSDMTREAGRSATLNCLVNGDKEYSYSWYKSDKISDEQHSISHSTASYQVAGDSKTLTIASLTPSDAGYYHCKVTYEGNYVLISNSAYLKVVYFARKALVMKYVSAPVGAESKILECDVPESDSVVEVSWYNTDPDLEVDDPRKFIIANGATSSYKAGSLYIMNVIKHDAGIYECRVRYNGEDIVLTKVIFSISGSASVNDRIPDIEASVGGSSKIGGTAVFFCAGAGKPAPRVTWKNSVGAVIQTGDTISLEDYDRTLRIGNVEQDSENEYHCTVSNSKGERTVILYLNIEPQSYDVKFLAAPQSQKIYPNKYTPFSLECLVETQGSRVMYWLKNGDILMGSQRIVTLSDTSLINGTSVRNTTLHFETPNESDIGIYQCIVENVQQMRQTTAYVNVRKGDVYEINESGLDYFVHDKALTVDLAEEYCSTWHKDGHLVSIMNNKENERVLVEMALKGISRAWIGLTSEDVNSPGYWKWTQPGDLSTTFSHWHPDVPENSFANYAIILIDAERNGHWYDVSNYEEHPFVCKRYTLQCPSIEDFFESKATPSNVMELSSSTYGVGETVTINCVGDVKTREVVTCNSRGEFHPGEIACPIISGGYTVSVSAGLLVGALVWFMS